MGAILNKKSLNLFSSKDGEFDKLKEEIFNLKSLNKQLNIKNKDLNYKLKNLRIQSKILNEDNNNLSGEVSSLYDNNKGYVEEIKNLKEENIKSTNEIANLKQKINELTKRETYGILDFTNFQQFLLKSYISPIVEAPFDNDAKRVFVFMDYLGEQLRKNISNYDSLPLISVIMPTYNRENVIMRAINSVLNQTYSNFELIIVDDASSDDTISLLKSINDDRIKIFQNNENMGASYSRNIGLKNAEGDIIMYLDSDNEWESEYVKTMVGAFIELPDADALYSAQYLYKCFNSKPYAARFTSYNKSLLHNHNYIDLNCFSHKSNILNEIKGFDESICRLVDWDFILRISNDFKIYSIPVILSKYYNHDFEDRISNLPFDYMKACKSILDKNKIPIKPYPPLNKKISIIIPNFESFEQINMCIDSILSNESQDLLDIIVVDNNSGNKVRNYLINLESEGKIRLILNDINYGFNYAVSQGLIFQKKILI